MKKIIKRSAAFLMAAVMCISLAACGSATDAGKSTTDTSTSTTDSGKEGSNYIKVVLASSADPGNYLPFNATNSVRDQISYVFYEGLFEDYYKNGELTPVIASGYERTGDGVYLITLNNNVHDSKGNPITADDVVFCYNKILEIGERKSDCGELQSVKKVDDYKVEMTFTPDLVGAFERVVTAVSIVSQKSYEESKTGFSSDPIGTGPYVIKDWLPGSSITFLKDENYWNKDGVLNNQNCDEIEVRFIAESAQVAIELETGAVDFAYNLSTKDTVAFDNKPGFATETEPYTMVRTIGFNCDESNVFSNQKLRQAVSYAIDGAAIVQSIYDGNGGLPNVAAVPDTEGNYFVDYVKSWNDSIPYEYNLEKAKELMAEAGYPDGGLIVRLMTKDMPEYRSTSEVIQAYLAEIGITVEILAYENALYQTYRYQPDAYDFYLCQVAPNGSSFVPCGWKWYLTARENGKNTFFSDDPKMQELLNASLGRDTHSEKAVDELAKYIEETDVMYPYAYTYTNYVHVDTMKPFIFLGQDCLPNLSTYSDSWARHK
ncbi:ABC transporter substrate-binding protein [Lacrimispora sp. 38-1]|uniref:ABC transporter substrate-binding protein n=1 Tax=Lacrimispora sp. 38-1 TaxID=3125778 RepID=UPI003CFA139D